MMEQNIMDAKAMRLKELREQRELLEAEIESLEGEFKSEMISREMYTLSGEGWKITWNEVSTTRFDQKSFKESKPELFNEFLVTNESRRFLAKFI